MIALQRRIILLIILGKHKKRIKTLLVLFCVLENEKISRVLKRYYQMLEELFKGLVEERERNVSEMMI